eukprot:1133621-Pelagomonas_calceolata.AAC.13
MALCRYLILDEGHRVKNEDALISQGMRQVNRNHVIMLTGAIHHSHAGVTYHHAWSGKAWQVNRQALLLGLVHSSSPVHRADVERGLCSDTP